MIRVLLQRVVLLFVFVAMPVAFVLWSMQMAGRSEQEEKIDREIYKLQQLLMRLSYENNDAEMVCRAFARGFQQLREASPRQRVQIVRRLRRQFKGMFDFALFDEQGRFLERLSITERSRRALERAHNAMVAKQNRELIDDMEKRYLKGFLNVPQIEKLMVSAGRPTNLGHRGRFSLMAWDGRRYASPRRGVPGGYYLFLHTDQLKPAMFSLRVAIRYANRHLRRIQVGLAEFGGPPGTASLEFYPNQINESGLASAIVSAVRVFNDAFRTPHSHGVVRKMDATRYLVAKVSQPDGWSENATGLIRAACAFWIMFGVVRIGFLGHLPLRMGISWKLMGLFLYAMGPPMLLILLGGTFALRNYERLLQNDLETLISAKLQLFDGQFVDEQRVVEERYRDIVRETRLRNGDLAYLKGRLASACRTEPCTSVFVTNQAGDSLLADSNRVDDRFRETTKFAQLLNRELLNRINRTYKLDNKTFMFEVTSNLFSTILGQNSNYTVNTLLDEMGRFTQIQMGEEASLFLVEPLYDENGVAQHMVMVVCQRAYLEQVFLTRHLSELERLPDLPMRVNAYPRYGYIRTIRSFTDDSPMVQRLLKQVDQFGGQARGIEVNDKETRLWVGARGNNTQYYRILAVLSLSPFHARVQDYWSLLLVGAVVMVVVAMALGVLLTEHFLKPIGSLIGGIQAVENRDFEHQIVVLQEDEFGEMARMFNRTIEGMKDLSVARIVQESLFPQAAVTVGAYHIFGQSEAMTDIGGDYFDYYALGEHRLVGLVGDVSGHGVAAALVMAMAKCAITLDDRPDKSILECVRQFNRFLHQVMNRKKMMTMFIFSLDVVTHRLTYVNCGHNYPFLFRAAHGTIETLEAPSMPLGIRPKDRYATCELLLDPGDTLLMYTDGLVEAQDRHDTMVDYDRARAWFRESAERTPEEVVAQVREHLRAFTRGAPVLDDMTLICLKNTAIRT